MGSDTRIFVFGSNRRGIHGKGAALYAVKYRGAVAGRGEGHFGQSYALPTKLTPWIRLSLQEVAEHAARFIAYAQANSHLRFEVTAVGCGLAGFTPEQIAPLFSDAPPNCDLPDQFLEALGIGPRP